MRRKITRYLFFIFLLFGIAGGIAVISLTRVSRDLKSLITLHRVEILRQDLIINLQTVQKHLYTIGTSFGSEIDIIVGNVSSLDRAVTKCNSCHHRPALARRLNNLVKYVGKYEDALSAFITTTANPERVKRLQSAAVEIGAVLLRDANEMTFIANEKLQERTEQALSDVHTIKNFLLASLFLTMLFGFIVAVSLTKEILTPIHKLSDAARRVSSGELGYTVNFRDSTEFGQLAKTFNEMSLSLKEGYQRTLSYMAKLKGLYNLTLSLHMVTEEKDIYRELITGVADLVKTDKAVLVLIDKKKGFFTPMIPYYGFKEEEIKEISSEQTFIMNLYSESTRRALIFGSEKIIDNGIFKKLKGVGNMLVFWLRRKEELTGFLLLLRENRQGSFTEEDVRLLSIMGNNFAVALDNALLYRDLQEQMKKLKEAQEQLIQAAKLAAIGELAANVAHEINNPLTTILGYSELLREEEDMESVKRDLAIIESESLRARDIVKQLLEFSRRRKLELSEMDVVDTIEEVLKLVAANLKESRIKVVKEYLELPPIIADRNQLKQVFLNIMNNAIQAMPDGGTLTIRTEQFNGHVYVSFSDTGTGISDEVAQRIFEPFFTTKKEKGTGLGLPISYRIIQEHGGRIDVRSSEGRGTMFRIMLPVRRPF
ncbi:MAG TPA: HAMP domain-containing protein [Nitrospirae bacterium]|nr:sporulation kinase E [bacterium BMS3Abin08]HDY70058.1 HAMP domain-containing protein [Nitrospirota bacterium]